MQPIEELLEEAGFDNWEDSERRALVSMMHILALRKPIDEVADRTGRVLKTFIAILDRHLPAPPDKEGSDDVD